MRIDGEAIEEKGDGGESDSCTMTTNSCERTG